MIDQRGPTKAPRLALTLPVPAAAARALVLAAVFVCAACGLVYELELVALASYLVGDSVTQASVVLSVMVFAMGCGSLLAKRLRAHAALGFAAVEAALALVGGLSVMVLYAVFTWYGHATPAIVGCSFAIGILIGAEVPLLMTLVQRIRRQDAGGAVADLFAADYVGALAGGLAFPFLLLPGFGQLTGALITGVVNAVAGGATVLWLFRGDLSRRARGLLLAANLVVLAVLGCAAVAAGPFERAARQEIYGGQVRVAEQTAVQEIVLTGGTGGWTGPEGGDASGRGSGGGDASGPDASGSGPVGAGSTLTGSVRADSMRTGSAGAGSPGAGGAGKGQAGKGQAGKGQAGTAETDAAGEMAPLRLYLDGRLRVCGTDSARYDRALAGPAMSGPPGRDRSRVLVLGGGDGLALRQVLGFSGVRAATVVDTDPELLRLGRTDPGLAALNGHAFADPRVRTVAADPFDWLRSTATADPGGYDVILADLPDAGVTSSAKLYSEEFYGLAARALAPGGRLGVHAGRGFWTVDATLRAVGLHTAPYRLAAPACQAPPGLRPAPTTWDFLLAAATPVHLPASFGPAATAAARSRPPGPVPPSTLLHPRF